MIAGMRRGPGGRVIERLQMALNRDGLFRPACGKPIQGGLAGAFLIGGEWRCWPDLSDEITVSGML